MIVYQETWTRHWWPTQSEAKEAARQSRIGGGDRAGFVKVDVPTSEGREALCEWLNDLERTVENAAERDAAIVPAGSTFDPPPPPAAPPREPLAVAPDGAKVALITVEEFIQNADAAQLASVADNVCWRIKELAKALRP